MPAPKKQPGQKRLHEPVSPEAGRVGRELRAARGTRPRTAIASQVPTSPQNLSNLEGGQYQLNGAQTQYKLMRLGEIYGKDFGLSFVREHLAKKRQAKKVLKFPDTQHVKVIPVPIVGRIAAGEPIEAIEEDKGKFVYMAENEVVGINNPRALRVVGDSMKGLHILNNDLVIIGDSPTHQNRIAAVYVIEDGNYSITLKVWKQKGGRVELRPANPKFKPKTITKKSKIVLEVFGVVFKLLRNYDYSKLLDSEVFVAEGKSSGTEGVDDEVPMV